MTPGEKLDSSLSAIRSARLDSKQAALVAISSLLKSLQEVLCGDRLHGLPNLGSNRNKLYAAPVRVKRGAHTRVPLQPKGRMLVLTDRGELQIARIDATEDQVVLHEPSADELRCEDVEKLANTIVEMIETHAAATAKSEGRFRRMEAFSKRLFDVLEYE